MDSGRGDGDDGGDGFYEEDQAFGVFEEGQAFVDSLMTRDGLDEIFTLLICRGTIPLYEGGCVLVEPAICREQWKGLIDGDRDHFEDFLQYKCVSNRGDDLRVKRVVFYNAYAMWCKDNGYTELRNKKAYAKMRALNYKEIKTTGEYFFLGIDLVWKTQFGFANFGWLVTNFFDEF